MGLGALARGLLNAGTAQAEGQQQGALQARQLAMMAQEIAMQNELRRAQAAEAEGRGNLYNAQATNVPTPWERYGVPSTIRGITAGAHDQALTTIGAGHDVARVTAAKTATGARTKAQADQDARDKARFIQAYTISQLRPHYDVFGRPAPSRTWADVTNEANQMWEAEKNGRVVGPATGGSGGAGAGGDQVPFRSHAEIDAAAAAAKKQWPDKVAEIDSLAAQSHQQYKSLPMTTPGQTVVPGPSAGGPPIPRPPGGPDEDDEDEDESSEAVPQ